MREFDESTMPIGKPTSIPSFFYYSIFYPAVEIIGAMGIALIIWYGAARY